MSYNQESLLNEAISFLTNRAHIAEGVLYKDGRINAVAILEYLKSVEAGEVTLDESPEEMDRLADEAQSLIYAFAAQSIVAEVKKRSSVVHRIRRPPRSRLI
ncbi:MAG TPA: hypothetical protein DCX25_03220 [Candidatus Pacebacteria bacterium]|nr:MAG: hypothetical protein UX00_C0001G0011 [Microgenomates group bacterium GW2011_GWB1_45_17]KKU24203.1 MAG: hypothetical protein UX36_C0002G0186 [Microgenomates group bacterium GW2011_GWC1_46_15]KKU24919.1 MAG: hypothetical protein UX35_C0001G0101 [Microgenomates group bacterium GW2011_GWA1_46_15]HAV15315.1 hypothetical protein [Candidatus Paceibacterota bacterium]HCR11414.1 hypothetical protein [Candidatus Paceibacterota bacterium]